MLLAVNFSSMTKINQLAHQNYVSKTDVRLFYSIWPYNYFRLNNLSCYLWQATKLLQFKICTVASLESPLGHRDLPSNVTGRLLRLMDAVDAVQQRSNQQRFNVLYDRGIHIACDFSRKCISWDNKNNWKTFVAT